MKIPTVMKAAILTELNSQLTVDEVTMPDKLDYGQVLVQVCYSGICGSQLGEIAGVKGEDPYLPHLLGHEGSGRVMAIGAGVRYVKPGDHVVMHWKKGNGIESLLPKYLWQDKPLNAGWVTTFNEYAVVSENRLTTIPKDFDLKAATLFGCAITTGLGVINNDAQLKIGESVVVIGAGGVGLNVVQGAAMVSANPIIAVDLFERKLELAKKFGATHLINCTNCDMIQEILKITGSAGADVVVDITGNPKVIAQAYRLTQPQGRTILVGVPKAGDDISIFSLPLHFGKIITGSFGGQSNPSIDIPRYINLYQSGKLNLKTLITDRFPFEAINNAITMMRAGDIAGRCLLEINP